MIQYTSCADPSESAARKERLRQAEQNGQFEESVAQMARASLANLPARNREDDQPNSPERVPALLRLGQPPSPPLQMENERIPSPTRTPALLRIGQPSGSPQVTAPPMVQDTGRRKPGRPPGSKRVSSSPKTLTGASSRKRKLKQTKAPPCRRKLLTQPDRSEQGAGPSRPRKGKSQEQDKQKSASSNSDNQPLRNMIPTVPKRKKADFWNPSTPVP
ncbi:synapsin-1-like [Brassica napus]|uniref:synapsin-1-like n=1 Tax=Brassica napus TaxID=3708 RepID=UPI0020791B4E|nr:synapsin-1-like [Brassica napus]